MVFTTSVYTKTATTTEKTTRTAAAAASEARAELGRVIDLINALIIQTTSLNSHSSK